MDLRSDVLSVPSHELIEAIASGPVGDDVFDDDPTGNLLQTRLAAMFGHQDALFFPSTSMANLASVMTWTQPGDEVIFWEHSHAMERESASYARVAGIMTRQVPSPTGILHADQLVTKIRAYSELVAYPTTKMIFIENPTFYGHSWQKSDLEALSSLAKAKGLKIHVDGARIFNALVASGIPSQQLGGLCDSMSICLSKGLCCPAGSVVVGSSAFIKRLKQIRKAIGGGMRQIGLLCNGALHSLDNLYPRVIEEDHKIASKIAQELSGIEGVELVDAATNMVYFRVPNSHSFVIFMQSKGIRVKAQMKDRSCFRIVIYNVIRDKQIENFLNCVKLFVKSASLAV